MAEPTPDPLDCLLMRILAMQAATPQPSSIPSSEGIGKHRRAEERRELAVIHKTLNVVIAEIQEAADRRSRRPRDIDLDLFDDLAERLASQRENTGFDNYVALLANALATAYANGRSDGK